MMSFLSLLLGLALWAAVLLVVVCILTYFLPTLVAAFRNHPHTGAIGLLNLFLGWTFLGWVGALVWAVLPVGGDDAGPPPPGGKTRSTSRGRARSPNRSPSGRPMKTVN